MKFTITTRNKDSFQALPAETRLKLTQWPVAFDEIYMKSG